MHNKTLTLPMSLVAEHSQLPERILLLGRIFFPDSKLQRTLLSFAGAVALVLALTVAWVGTAGADTTVPLPPDQQVEILTGPAGLPVLVYVDQSTGRTTVYPCNDVSCSTYDTIQLEREANIFVSSWSAKIDTTGRVFVIMRFGAGSPGNRGRVTICDQPLCGGRAVTEIELQPIFSSFVSSQDRFMALLDRPDGFSLVHCADRDCAATVTTPVGTPGSPFKLGDEFAFVEFDEPGASVTINRCIDHCASQLTSTFTIPAAALEKPRFSGALSLRPLTSSGEAPTFLLYGGVNQTLINCDAADCASPTFTPLVTQIATNREFVLNDLGHLVYLQQIANSILLDAASVVTCADVACTTTTQSPPVSVARRLGVNAKGHPRYLERQWLVTCDQRTCGAPEYPPLLVARCQGPQGIGDLQVAGSLDEWTVRSGESESSMISGAAVHGSVIRIGGRGGPLGNGVDAVIGVQAGTEAVSAALSYACTGPATHAASSTCQAGKGRIDVRVASHVVPRTFEVRIGELAPRSLTITADIPINEARALGTSSINYPEHGSLTTTTTGRSEGLAPVTVVDSETGDVVFAKTFTIDCSDQALAHDEATIVSTCLGGGGRIDITIANPNVAEQEYRVVLLEHQGGDQVVRIVRSLAVDGRDWWRLPITGRPDATHTVVVSVGTDERLRQSVVVACDPGTEAIDEPAVQIVSACRAGLGYVLFLFANDSAQDRSWVIEFTGVPNRSTSAAPFAQSVRAVTGRPSGVYTATIAGLGAFDIEVDC